MGGASDVASTDVHRINGCVRGLSRGNIKMILEVAVLNIRPGESADFERAFAEAQAISASMPGCASHQLLRCLETPDRYLFLVHWQTLDDHTQGFRQAPQYQEWKRLLHHFYEPFPTGEHYEPVSATQPDPSRLRGEWGSSADGEVDSECLAPTTTELFP
jgi:heme-degrading monooxygenase HmoA